MEFRDFLVGQGEVYAKFRDTSKLEAEGTKPNISNFQGYMISFRHRSEIAQRAEDFSKRLSQTVPLMVYDSDTIHTTISDFGIKEDFTQNKDILERLCSCVRDVIVQNKPEISYREWLYNQNTVLVAGIPNQAFFNVAQNICSLGEKNRVQLRLPWGAHITAGRFTEQKSPRELSDFLKLMKEAPVLGTSMPEKIDVAYFDFNRDGFKIICYERFKIKI